MNENSVLLERVKKGDKKAEEKLVENNMKLVWSIAGRFSGYGYETDDLSQIGAIGLIKAIEKFDFSFGVKFSTYAVPVIMGEIKRFLRDDGIIKISRSLKESAIKGKKCAEALRYKLGREPTIEEISKESGIKSEILLEAFDASLPVDTITPVDSDGKEIEFNLPPQNDSEENLINKILVKEMLDKLSKRDRQVLILRYFKGKTQEQTAKIIGVSQVHVSRIEKSAIALLKSEFSC